MARPLPPPVPSPADRRTAQRHEIELEVGFESDHNFYTGLTQDISTGGLFVATHQIKRVGERVTLKFKLPNHAQPIEVETEVRWVRENSNFSRSDAEQGMGLKFINLDAECQAAINAFLDRRESIFYDDE